MPTPGFPFIENFPLVAQKWKLLLCSQHDFIQTARLTGLQRTMSWNNQPMSEMFLLFLGATYLAHLRSSLLPESLDGKTHISKEGFIIHVNSKESKYRLWFNVRLSKYQNSKLQCNMSIKKLNISFAIVLVLSIQSNANYCIVCLKHEASILWYFWQP